MSSFSGTFNADNQAGNSIILSPGQSVSYSITTASLTGSVVFEKTTKLGKGFTIVDTMTDTDSGTYVNESSQDEIVRLRCVELDDDPGSETVTWSLADVAGEESARFENPDTGLWEMRFTDAGAEFRRQVKITDTPTDDAHAVRKDYVDGLVNGLKWKQSVKVATTANGTLASAFANGQTVDGVSLATGDRILIKDQSAGAENGIYTVNASGAPTRAEDADAGAELISAAVHVEQGTANADKEFVCTNNSITLESTSITFVSKSSTVVHNNLSGLQGGTTNEYYHLTSAQHTAVGTMVTNGLDALTTAEIDQLENIGSTTISAAQWGYVGGADQAVKTSDKPSFAGVALTNRLDMSVATHSASGNGEEITAVSSANVVWMNGSGALRSGMTLPDGGYTGQIVELIGYTWGIQLDTSAFNCTPITADPTYSNTAGNVRRSKFIWNGSVWFEIEREYQERSAVTSLTDSTGVSHDDTIANASLTDSSGGSTDGTVAAISGSGADTDINNNFAEVTASINVLEANDSDLAQKIEEILAVLRNNDIIST